MGIKWPSKVCEVQGSGRVIAVVRMEFNAVRHSEYSSVQFRRDFDNGGVGCVEMLFRCNILALVGGGSAPRFSPNKVRLAHHICSTGKSLLLSF